MIDETKVQQYVLLAKGAKGRALQELVSKATSEPGLFVFSELLLMPQIQEMAKGDSSPYFNLLQLFAYGTWPDYTSAAPGTLPGELNPAQSNKLKQLTVVSLALQQKTLPYSVLQAQLGISSVRGLEDYLITECFYSGLLRGKLDQKQGCVQVHDVVGRDVRPDQLASLERGLQSWLSSAEDVLQGLEERVSDVVSATQAAQARKDATAAEVEEMRKLVKTEMEVRNADMLMEDAMGQEYMEEDRVEGLGGPAFRFDQAGPSSWLRERERDRHGQRSSGARSKKRIQR